MELTVEQIMERLRDGRAHTLTEQQLLIGLNAQQDRMHRAFVEFVKVIQKTSESLEAFTKAMAKKTGRK